MISDFPRKSNGICGGTGTPFGNFILLLHRSATSPLKVLDKKDIGGGAYQDGAHWIYIVSIAPSDFRVLKELIAEWYPAPEDLAWIKESAWVDTRSHFLSVFSIEPGANSYFARP